MAVTLEHNVNGISAFPLDGWAGFGRRLLKIDRNNEIVSRRQDRANWLTLCLGTLFPFVR